MCGYCIEANVAFDFVENQRFSKETELADNGVSIDIYLQESRDILNIISKLKMFDNFPGSIDIAFFRMWETLLFRGYDDIYKSLINEYGIESVNNFLAKLKNNCTNKEWEPLADHALYSDRNCWEQFTSNINPLIESSEITLKSYYNWWVLGINKETSNPEKRLRETGIMDPIANTTPEDWKKFYSTFPFVYFSFLVLSKYQSRSDIIKQIALKHPDNVPGLSGYDLWLQRKALASCIKEYGVQFILDNHENIRFELISYSLLQESISTDELDALKEYLLHHARGGSYIGVDSVVQLIDNLKINSLTIIGLTH